MSFSDEDLLAATTDLRDATYARLADLGLDKGGYAIPESFSSTTRSSTRPPH